MEKGCVMNMQTCGIYVWDLALKEQELSYIQSTKIDFCIN